MKHWRSLALALLLVCVLPAVSTAARALAKPEYPTEASTLWEIKHCVPGREHFPAACRALRSPAPADTHAMGEIDETGFVKGLYISHNGVGSEILREHVKSLLETTELNAVVMDFKGDRGYLTFPTEIKLAQDIGADKQIMMRDWSRFLRWFEERNVYTIARIVVFKDEPLAAAHPEWAVTHAETGEIWRDGESLGWIDPTREEAWAYNIALAVEAAEKGFDEIQFDYIRFPSGGKISKAQINLENTQENRTLTISTFLSKAKEALTPYDVKLAADVFGYVTWRNDDLKIGQTIEAMAPHLDVLSPMLYPSTFAAGLPGLDGKYREAIAYPDAVVAESTKRALARGQAVNPQLEIRPWIQDFPDYAFDRRTYTPDEIRAQMLGAKRADARGWMLWDPAVRYTAKALVSAAPSHPPNTDGKVLVLEYHRIGEPEERWQRTPDSFRADLARLLSLGFYPVNLRDLVEGKLDSVPAGKRPIVLTFDDSTIGQFRVLEDGSVDPDSAVGILRAFHTAHPADWPLRATFFVLQGDGYGGYPLFGQPEWAEQKLTWLAAWGMEIGSHTLSHAKLNELAPEAVQRELALSKAQLEAWLPGYQVVSLSVPYGIYPENPALVMARTYEDTAYAYAAAVEVAGGLAPSPRSADFDPWHIPRVQAIQSELDDWLRLADQPGVHYVSAGE